MKLITVECRRTQDSAEMESRIAITIAGHEAEAEELCRSAYRAEGYDEFRAIHTLGGFFGGPATLLGYSGSEAHWLGEQDRE